MVAKKVFLSTAFAWGVFFAYLQFGVPWIEGQSADRVPEIDLLGVLRVEQPGQWLSLFPSDAWQRDPQLRNIIQADGNILLFKDYQHQADGSLKVKGLTLLLFDTDSASNDPTTQANAEPLQAFPVVVEAIDDAILMFDTNNAPGLARYGDLKQIDFLGNVKFWRSGPEPADTFQLETRELTIQGTLAKTQAPLQFQFGDSFGTATGLELVFDNLDSLHPANATLTKISGIRHLRLQRLHSLNIATDAKQNRLEVSCGGPAEFSFSHLTARFSQDVQVLDHGSQHWILGQELLVRFDKSTTDDLGVEHQTLPSSAPGDSLLPKGLVAREVLAFGAPATGGSTDQTLKITAPCLSFNVAEQEFNAGDIPRDAEDWIQEAIVGYRADVEVNKDQLRLVVPHLQYRSAPPDPVGSPTPNANSMGTMEAVGDGTMWYTTDSASPPVIIKWTDRLVAGADPESQEQILIRVLGNTRSQLDAETTVHADAIYLWMHKAPETMAPETMAPETMAPETMASAAVDPEPSAATRSPHWIPDLLLAQGRVQYQAPKLQAAVREARVYFPQPLPTDGSRNGIAESNNLTAIARETPLETARGSSSQTRQALNGTGRIGTQVEANRSHPVAFLAEATAELPAGEDSKRETRIAANSMIVQLSTNPPTELPATHPPAKPGSQYAIQSIDLSGEVSVEEADASNTSLAQVRPSAYHLSGHRIVGIAQSNQRHGTPQHESVNRSSAGLQNQNLLWTITAQDGSVARVKTPEAELLSTELHFDQLANVVWSTKSGSISFAVPATAPTVDSQPTTAAIAQPVAGRGSARWKSSLQFNGQEILLDGQVTLDIQQPRADGDTQRLQAYGDRLRIELSQAVSFADTDSPSDRLSVKRLILQQLQEVVAATETAQPVRVYHQLRSATDSLISQEVVWAPQVELQPAAESMLVSGPGSLWSVRAKTPKIDKPVMIDRDEPALTYLKVQFQRSLDGRWGQGTCLLNGPVVALYGKAHDWQIMDDETRLLTPLRLTSDSMTIDRWQSHPTAPIELEWEATGRVHVRGEQFEGTAHSIKFAQTQDRLYMRGDSRAPAKFWQLNSGQRNHLAAQKIWYRPKHEDFHFEGFQEGNLNFFSGRRGSMDLK